MKITELLQNGKVQLSCEMFPPKKETGLEQVKEVVREIAQLSPSYMSVTYGAGGTTKGLTTEIADEIENDLHTPALAHLTCVASTREEVLHQLEALQQAGVENVLALRGDLPQDSGFSAPPHYRYAYELIEEIRRAAPDLCIGGACYPEGHLESPSRDRDLDYLRHKVDCGCSFLTTQMFFDNNIFYNFLFRAMARGIDVPVIPGIMPVTNTAQIKRICALSGTALPPRFLAIADRFSEDPDAMKQAGIAYATEQIIDLIANGVHNIHIYTMNRPEIAGAIFRNLSAIIGK